MKKNAYKGVRRRGFLKVIGAGMGIAYGIGKLLIPEVHAKESGVEQDDVEKVITSGGGWDVSNLSPDRRHAMFDDAMVDADCALLIERAPAAITPSIYVEGHATEMELPGEYRIQMLTTPFVPTSDPRSTTAVAYLMTGKIIGIRSNEEFPVRFIAFDNRTAFAAYRGDVREALYNEETRDYLESLFDPAFSPTLPSTMQKGVRRLPCQVRDRLLPPCKKACDLECAERCGARIGFGAACVVAAIACAVAWYTALPCLAALGACGALAWWWRACWLCARRCKEHNDECERMGLVSAEVQNQIV